MKHRHLVHAAIALCALAAGTASAQNRLSTHINAGSSVPGAMPAPGALAEGSGTNGRGIIVIPQPAGAGAGANVMGAGAAGPRGQLSAVEIAAMFLSADTNHDGELSRAEAQGLPLPMAFDDIDTNHDGVISRFEFDEAFR